MKFDFCTRAEFREMTELAEKHGMNKYEKDRLKNAYLKAYVTGIIDNYEALESHFKEFAKDDPKYAKDRLTDLLYDMKAKALEEYSDF